jgi:anti-sigma B factor antagonist
MSQTSALTSSTATGCYAARTPFACTWREGGSSAAWVHVAGELDLLTAPQLRQTLREAQLYAHMVVLDLRALAFMDCSGVHVVLDAAADARRVGGRLILARGPVHIDRLFAITRVCEEVEIFDLDPSETPVRALLRLSRTWAAA